MNTIECTCKAKDMPFGRCCKASQPGAEPVAYLYHDARTPKDAHPWLHSTMLVLAADRRPGLAGETPLYTAQPRARQPLSQPEKQRLWNDAMYDNRSSTTDAAMDYGSAIEAAHGIGAAQKGKP